MMATQTKKYSIYIYIKKPVRIYNSLLVRHINTHYTPEIISPLTKTHDDSEIYLFYAWVNHQLNHQDERLYYIYIYGYIYFLIDKMCNTTKKNI